MKYRDSVVLLRNLEVVAMYRKCVELLKAWRKLDAIGVEIKSACYDNYLSFMLEYLCS